MTTPGQGFTVEVDRLPAIIKKLGESFDALSLALQEPPAEIPPPGSDPLSATVSERMGSRLADIHQSTNVDRRLECQGMRDALLGALDAYLNAEGGNVQVIGKAGEGL